MADIYSLGGILYFMLTGKHPSANLTFSRDGRPQKLGCCRYDNPNSINANKMYLYSEHTLMHQSPISRIFTFRALTEYKEPCKVGS